MKKVMASQCRGEKETMMHKKPELLSPAGDMEKLQMAFLYGADAVYLGGPAYGLRSASGNFSREELKQAIAFAHQQGKKVYITVNIYPHNDDLVDLPEYLSYLYQIKADAILVSDLGVFSLAKETVPELAIHISTQANTTNWAAAMAWHRLGASRVVLAREMSCLEIQEVRRRCPVELEMFVHGAMCISYSGRCLISSYFTGRDANRGACTQPCRWKYRLVEEKRPNQYFPIEEDTEGTYFFNSKDMCLLPHLPDVFKSGVDSLKIEGRMKGIHYVASVTKAYRLAIDSYFSDPKQFKVDPEWLAELDKVSHREYTTGFYYGSPSEEDQIYGTSSYTQTSDFIGLVQSYDATTGWALVEQRNNMRRGQEIELFQPSGPGFRQYLTAMQDELGNMIFAAPHAQQKIWIKMEQPVEVGTILRRPLERR